jgi:hypothetical protein
VFELRNDAFPDASDGTVAVNNDVMVYITGTFICTMFNPYPANVDNRVS